MRTILIVAVKELMDHITSKRFLALLSILMALSIYSIIIGVDDYNISLNSYKDYISSISVNPAAMEIINGLRIQIQDAENNGASPEEIQYLKSQLEYYINPSMPSILMIFYDFNKYFIIIGPALAMSIGFDSISREREMGTFKALLSHPIYRDSVINGKALGAIILLAVVNAVTFLLIVAVMLIYGIVPSGGDIVAIVLLLINALLLFITFTGISIAVSALSKNSTMSILYLLGIAFLCFTIMEFSGPITDLISGPEPVEEAGNGIVESANNTGLLGGTTNEQIRYYENKRQIYEAINIISPIYNYNIISNAIISKEKPYVERPLNSNFTIFDALSLVWVNILVLFIEIFISFSLSYVSFIRMDIR